MMAQPMNAIVRRELLDRIFALSKRISQLQHEQKTGLEQEHSSAAIFTWEEMDKEIRQLQQRYLDGLPVRPLSRCPFSGELLAMPIDDGGLDGLWWNNHNPQRPQASLPKTFFALDGALALSGPPEDAPFLCAPGPDVPFVLPRLLQFVQIKAVISALKIGKHMSYPVFYFSEPMLYGEKRVNDWGTERYYDDGNPVPGLLTPGQYVHITPDSDEYDFDLEPWIRSGKLLWIAPDDSRLMLHSHVAGCPYLNLPGSRLPKFIQAGAVWEDVREDMEQDNSEFDREYFRLLLEQLERGEVS